MIMWMDCIFTRSVNRMRDDLAKTLEAVEEKFGSYLYKMKWLNFGGGHHITRADYDIGLLEKCILHMKEKYDLDIYLEPGEANCIECRIFCHNRYGCGR